MINLPSQAAALPTANKRTEAGLALLDKRWQREELGTARLAFTPDRPSAYGPIPGADHKEVLIIGNAATISRAGAMRIADVAGRDEILRPVIGLIPVQVIRDERTFADAAPRHPGYVASAPMALVRSGSDLVEQYEPRERYISGLPCKRMAGNAAAAFALRFLNLVLSLARVVVAAARAELCWRTARRLAENFASACSAVTQSGTPFIHASISEGGWIKP